MMQVMPLTGMALAFEGHAARPTVKRVTTAGLAVNAVNEAVLIREAQAGSREAFEALVHRYDQDVLCLALNLLRRPEEARDVYQEAFLKAYKNLHRFRFECSFYTWIYRIVTNVCFDHLRRRSSRPEDQAPETVQPGTDGHSVDFFDRQQELRADANPERKLIGKEIGRQIEKAMDLLSARERVVFALKHFHGLKLRAIGEMLGTSEETVKNSLFRATQKLRTQLESLR
jgi:RNA polymerase sigma-70 factor (ECF subfamily)